MNLHNEKTRLYIYRIAVITIGIIMAIIGGRGVAEGDLIELIGALLGFSSSALPLALAERHVPTPGAEPQDDNSGA